jgi:hypothetical protein
MEMQQLLLEKIWEKMPFQRDHVRELLEKILVDPSSSQEITLRAPLMLKQENFKALVPEQPDNKNPSPSSSTLPNPNNINNNDSNNTNNNPNALSITTLSRQFHKQRESLGKTSWPAKNFRMRANHFCKLLTQLARVNSNLRECAKAATCLYLLLCHNTKSQDLAQKRGTAKEILVSFYTLIKALSELSITSTSAQERGKILEGFKELCTTLRENYIPRDSRRRRRKSSSSSSASAKTPPLEDTRESGIAYLVRVQ